MGRGEDSERQREACGHSASGSSGQRRLPSTKKETFVNYANNASISYALFQGAPSSELASGSLSGDSFSEYLRQTKLITLR